MPDNDNKRTKERVEVDQFIAVRDCLLNVELGSIVNLHEEGFMLMGSGNIRENCLYQLMLSLGSPVDGCQHIPVGAECLWLRETDSGSQHWAGFQIIDISDKDRALISKLISLSR